MTRQVKSDRVKRGKSNETDAPAKSKGRGIYQRKDGREVRRMAVYLPASLAKTLMVRCAQNDTELSLVVSEAVAQYLRSSD
jgi:hypothetical protein